MNLTPEEIRKAHELITRQSWYRHWPSSRLAEESETLRWEYVELQSLVEAHGGTPELAAGIEYVGWKLCEAAKETKRRSKLSSRLGAPTWSTSPGSLRIEAAQVAGKISTADFARGYLGVDLRHVGAGRYVGRCPLPGHDDDSPSFTVYPEPRGWYFFGCGRGGTLWTLVFQSNLEISGYEEALRVVRGWAGL